MPESDHAARATRSRTCPAAWIVCLVLLGSAGARARPLRGQETLPPEAGEASDEMGDGHGWLSAVLGATPHRSRVIPGLWAMHPFDAQFPELDGTSGFGGLWGHWFGATFINSYGDRTFIFGLERNWFAVRRGPLGFGGGYRVGLITGYDERLVELARHTPVLPFGGVLLWTQAGPIGLDAYYVYRAITLEASVVF